MTSLTVFLDRDGVLNRKALEGDYVKSPAEFEMLDGAVEAVRLLNEHGILVLVVTNQRGIALGKMTAADLERVHAKMHAELAASGARLDGVYYCPHHEGACDCRKPRIGLFEQAQRDHPEIDFARSVVIGDSMSDMAAAEQLGARGVLLSTPASAPSNAVPAGFERATTLLEAAKRLVHDHDPSAAHSRASARPSGVPTSITGWGSR